MAARLKHPPGPPMTLGNMRELGVHHLIAFCHNDACRHQAIIDVSKYPTETEVRGFRAVSSAGSAVGAAVGLRPPELERTADDADEAALRLIRRSRRSQTK